MANEELPNNFLSESEILKQREIGLANQNASPAARPYFTPSPSLRNRVQAALGAFGQGGQAVRQFTQGNAVPDAFGAFMAGATGGLGAPSAQDIAAAEAKRNAEIQMAQLDATPIEQISPSLADAYGLHGVPLGAINKVSPLINQAERSKTTLQAALANAEMRRQMAQASPAMKELLAAAFNIDPKDLETLKTAEAGPAFAMTVKKVSFQPVGNRLVRLVTDRQGRVLEAVDVGLGSASAKKVAELAGDYEGARINMDELTTLADKVITAQKPKDLTDFGALFSQIRQGATLKMEERAGTNPDVVKLVRGLEAIIPRFARAIGHVGVLTQQDVDSIKKAMPNVWDNKESFRQGLELMQEQMQNIMEQKIAAYNAGQQSGGMVEAPAQQPAQSMVSPSMANEAARILAERRAKKGKK